MNTLIRVLDDHTINKIAAGEVIENPSSVVKELIDNALDARATEIKIDIKQGGRKLIRVQDNGVGMGRDDALLSLQRHATSKIQSVEELFIIDTMGFRGEALPSIASISRFTLHTSKDGEATFLNCEGGKILSVEHHETSQGTTIEVKDLFFNVPVRQKFQKSPTYDASEILKSVMRLAMANPAVSFELTSDNASLISTKANDLKTRVEDVLGSSFLEESIPISMMNGGMTLTGFIGLPLVSKQNRLSQHLFINRRPVFSPFISECIRESYGSALPQGKFPLFVLGIEAPKDLIDVNVHPQKKEVRLRHFDQFKTLISRAIKDKLFGMNELPHESSFKLPLIPLEEKWSSFTWQPPEAIEEVALPRQPPMLFQETFVCKPSFSTLLLGSEIAIVNGGFPEKSTALFTLIDIKALKETILFDALKSTKIKEVTSLLIPHVFSLTFEESNLLKTNIAALEKSGIVIREFGKDHFCLEGLPALFGDLDLELFVADLIGGLLEHKGSLIEELLAKKVLRSVMRSSSDKRILTGKEFEYLLLKAHELGASFSPSGKTIYASLDAVSTKKIIQMGWR